MRYLVYIALIFIALTGTVFFHRSERQELPAESSAALVINGRHFTTEELADAFKTQQNYIQEREEFIDHLIAKELLIQESQRQGIHEEPVFQKTIQHFYEQSLIKAVIDRQLSQMAPTIKAEDQEIDRYIELLPKTLHFTAFTAPSKEVATAGDFIQSQQESQDFASLSATMRFKMLHLLPGEKSLPFPMGKTWFVYRLDSVTSGEAPQPVTTGRSSAIPGARDTISIQSVDREKIAKILVDQKTEEAIDDWVSGLRTKAHIVVKPEGREK